MSYFKAHSCRVSLFIVYLNIIFKPRILPFPMSRKMHNAQIAGCNQWNVCPWCDIRLHAKSNSFHRMNAILFFAFVKCQSYLFFVLRFSIVCIIPERKTIRSHLATCIASKWNAKRFQMCLSCQTSFYLFASAIFCSHKFRAGGNQCANTLSFLCQRPSAQQHHCLTSSF